MPLEKGQIRSGQSFADRAAHGRIVFPKRGEALRIAQRQRTNQDGVNDAEDGRVRPNAEDQDRDGDEGEPR